MKNKMLQIATRHQKELDVVFNTLLGTPSRQIECLLHTEELMEILKNAEDHHPTAVLDAVAAHPDERFRSFCNVALTVWIIQIRERMALKAFAAASSLSPEDN